MPSLESLIPPNGGCSSVVWGGNHLCLPQAPTSAPNPQYPLFQTPRSLPGLAEGPAWPLGHCMEGTGMPTLTHDYLEDTAPSANTHTRHTGWVPLRQRSLHDTH